MGVGIGSRACVCVLVEVTVDDVLVWCVESGV